MLFYAIQFNDPKLVEVLLDRGADIHHRYVATLDRPARECRYHIERTARSTLMHVAQHADPTMLLLLLQRGAQLDDVDGVEGRTRPIMRTRQSGWTIRNPRTARIHRTRATQYIQEDRAQEACDEKARHGSSKAMRGSNSAAVASTRR